MPSVHWIEYVKGFGAIIIGFLAAYIAYQQQKIQRDKLRFDLFEKRFALFNTLYETWVSVLGDKSNTIDYKEDTRIRRETRFLFGPEVMKYIQDLNGKLGIYNLQFKRLQAMNKAFTESHRDTPERLTQIDTVEALWADLITETENLENVFRPYVQLTHKL
jgi:hypothetical protein